MTKAMTIIALVCFLVAGTAAISILGRDSVPAARAEMTSSIVRSFVANRVSKQDKLAVTALASFEPPQVASPNEPLSQVSAFVDIEVAKAVASAAMPPVIPARPKLAARPAPQKSYALLSDAQIDGIKQCLKLSPDQEYYWPAVESALRALARKIHAMRQGHPTAPLDSDAAEIQQLKSAAMLLLVQLRENQKQEVRSLARLIGLEKVAAQI